MKLVSSAIPSEIFSKIDSLRLFGSMYRKDDDSNSDIDILCIGELNLLEKRKISDILKQEIGPRVSTAFYNRQRVLAMFEQGHLFAWHLYLESRSILDKVGDVIDEAGRPRPYLDCEKDIVNFIEILSEIQKSLKLGSFSNVYDAGIVYLCLRNIALCASWYSSSGLEYSKYSPFKIKFDGMTCNPPIDFECYIMFMEARHTVTRGNVSARTVDLEKLKRSILDAQEWAKNILNIISDKKEEKVCWPTN